MLARRMLWPCVCLCLCLSVSVTSRCSTKTAKHRITQTTPHDGPGTLVFWCRRPPRGRPQRGAKGRWGRLKSVNLDIIVFRVVCLCVCLRAYTRTCVRAGGGIFRPACRRLLCTYIALPLSSALYSRPLGLLSVHSLS